ncbi:MAG: MFS transporter [Candidatus Bathyarchaeota archaeon]|nr:MFS transporter [Candidatus Bathyarchaeum tardum]WGM90340.1 MAG: MFS transporter [Candidatus Bathyarchaeum tardum]WNZ29581.1 MAG: MFS transporter [Candidatus Bathyarchaeota archaeon]
MKQNLWILSSLFSTACFTGLGTLLPLYIIFQEGTVLDVAFTISLFNIALIISALFWGYLIDIFGKRKQIIVISYLGMVIGILLLYWTTNLVIVAILYAFVGFMRQGSQPAINLLVIETANKKDWGKMFSQIQLVSVFGMILAVTFGVFWIALFGLQQYFLACLIFGILGTIIAQTCISEPKIQFERNMIYKLPSSLFHRIRRNPVILPKLPSLKEVDTLIKMLKISILQGFPLFLFSAFFFYASSGMYFTAISPFLKQNMISDALIFAIYLTLYLTQAVAFIFASKFVDKYGEKKATLLSFLPRIFGTVLTVIAAVYLNTPALLFVIIFAFIAMDGAFSIYSTSTSLILFKLLPIKRRGYYLGIFGATTGVGLLTGSILSGEISIIFGYSTTFGLATTFLAISLIIMKISNSRT